MATVAFVVFAWIWIFTRNASFCVFEEKSSSRKRAASSAGDFLLSVSNFFFVYIFILELFLSGTGEGAQHQRARGYFLFSD